MDFLPAGEFIGEAHQVRTVSISQSPDLPDGEYSFIDMYCTDPKCDCRKTMIQVIHEGKLVSIINYGWESPDFYRTWMGRNLRNNPLPEMQGASIDITSPNLVRPAAMLAFFDWLLNEKWIALFKQHYREVKSAVSDTGKQRPSTTRRATRHSDNPD